MSTSTRFRRHYAESGVERVARRAPGALEKMRQRILRTPLTPMWHDGPTTNNFTITSNVHMPTSTAGGAGGDVLPLSGLEITSSIGVSFALL